MIFFNWNNQNKKKKKKILKKKFNSKLLNLKL